MYENSVRRRQWVDQDEEHDPAAEPTCIPKRPMFINFEASRPMWTIHADRRSKSPSTTITPDHAQVKLTQDELEGYDSLVISLPACSPDQNFAPSDYWLISHLHMGGKTSRPLFHG
ncbi:hypothetical protein OESDEN_22322 [Oesophagostomum dentatum]|uniref:Uncharacterized protein n=1 Tax=Oesophagostomum dentatum TaxID=61180 RepID=A0A0B1RY97_OESDE|nr:hypothetical protein OESDEN_22322 [Oesophagostomum dentatum]